MFINETIKTQTCTDVQVAGILIDQTSYDAEGFALESLGLSSDDIFAHDMFLSWVDDSTAWVRIYTD